MDWLWKYRTLFIWMDTRLGRYWFGESWQAVECACFSEASGLLYCWCLKILLILTELVLAVLLFEVFLHQLFVWHIFSVYLKLHSSIFSWNYTFLASLPYSYFLLGYLTSYLQIWYVNRSWMCNIKFAWQMKTGCVALVLCLNISVDPPDVIKISPCARMECWIGTMITLFFSFAFFPSLKSWLYFSLSDASLLLDNAVLALLL